MYSSRSNLSSVALEPQHRKSKIQTKQMKHINPNKSKWEANSDGRNKYYIVSAILFEYFPYFQKFSSNYVV